VYEQLLKDLTLETTHYADLFPQGKPFKSMYALHALREYIAAESQKVGIPRHITATS
jgi:ubiquitin carboxyl-terminal hydrolase 34